MAFTREARLVVSVSDGRLYGVDLNTGGTTLLSEPGIYFCSLTMNPISGELWGTPWDYYSRGKLYTVNPVTGDTTFRGSVSGVTAPIVSLAFDHNGRLFTVITGQKSGGACLCLIDTTTCYVSQIGWNTSNGYAIACSPNTISSGVRELASAPPSRFDLNQNYPNPFNPSTTIRYGLPHKSAVQLTLFNTLGQQVATLVNENQESGQHDIRFDGTGLASGVYFYRIRAGSFVQTKKFVLLR